MYRTRRMTPDQIAIAALSASLLGELLFPLSLLSPFSLNSAGLWFGLVLVLCGLALEARVAREMIRAGTTTKPNATPIHLVTTGPFRWSRNPFYLGLLLVMAGIMFVASLDWVILALPALWIGLDRYVVPAEEAVLANRFGVTWTLYADHTRRWL
jgi:protein-S-isoprenylcysteine O-methyltransferase Ste14